MDQIAKRRLERIAWNHANSSRDHEENWSFLFRKEGAVSHNFFPLSGLDDFDGDVDGLDLPWTPDRVEEIEDGADPTETEFEQWRWAKSKSLADGTDWTWVVWIVPLRLDGEIAGYAAFLCPPDADDPSLHGVFAKSEDAENALSQEGALLR